MGFFKLNTSTRAMATWCWGSLSTVSPSPPNRFKFCKVHRGPIGATQIELRWYYPVLLAAFNVYAGTSFLNNCSTSIQAKTITKLNPFWHDPLAWPHWGCAPVWVLKKFHGKLDKNKWCDEDQRHRPTYRLGRFSRAKNGREVKWIIVKKLCIVIQYFVVFV